jgi:hypothetical protein
LQGGNLIPDVRDNGGSRSGIERWKILIPGFNPERRSGQDRRKNRERRTWFNPYAIKYLKRSMDGYLEYINAHKGMGSFPKLSSLGVFFCFDN